MSFTSFTARSAAAKATSRAPDIIVLLARVLLVALFILSGCDKLTGYAGTVLYIASHGLPFPGVAAAFAVVVELGLGLLVLVGWKARWAALVMAVFTLAAALLFHAYWSDTAAERMSDYVNFWKNMSIAGGFLMLFACGAGRYSLDRS